MHGVSYSVIMQVVLRDDTAQELTAQLDNITPGGTRQLARIARVFFV